MNSNSMDYLKMDITTLYDSLIKLVSFDVDKTQFEGISFRIDIQPNFIVYDGDYTHKNGERDPINLKKIGKHNCHNFTAFIQQFHRAHTDGGKNKWNRARISRPMDGVYSADFVWDEEWERTEIEAFAASKSERGKWYWEENTVGNEGSVK